MRAQSSIPNAGQISLKTIGLQNERPATLKMLYDAEKPMIMNKEIFDYRTICASIFIDGQNVGHINIDEYETTFSISHVQLAQFFLEAVTVCIKKCQPYKNLSGNHFLLQQLLRGETVPEQKLTRFLKILGWPAGGAFRLYKISSLHDAPFSVNRFLALISRRFLKLPAFNWENGIVILLSLSDEDAADFHMELKEMMDAGGFYGGCSIPFFEVTKLPAAYQQACIAIGFGHSEKGSINFCEDYAWKYMQTEHFRPAKELGLLHPSLLKLDAYDKEHNTQFCWTLYQFLRYERNYAKTAREMFLHRNTLLYRIERIKELIDIDLGNPDEREFLYFSCQVKCSEG